MPNEKDTISAEKNNSPFFPISGRIESSDQVAVSRDNLPIFNTLIKGKAPDEYTNPPQWARYLKYPVSVNRATSSTTSKPRSVAGPIWWNRWTNEPALFPRSGDSPTISG